MYTNTVTYSQATAETALMKTENQVRVSSTVSLSEMNTVQGMLGKEKFCEIPDVRVLL